jgi:hypothetical protein
MYTYIYIYICVLLYIIIVHYTLYIILLYALYYIILLLYIYNYYIIYMYNHIYSCLSVYILNDKCFSQKMPVSLRTTQRPSATCAADAFHVSAEKCGSLVSEAHPFHHGSTKASS